MKSMMLSVLALAVSVSVHAENAPVNNPVQDFQLPVQTTNAPITDIPDLPAKTNSGLTNPFEFIYDELQAEIPKGGRSQGQDLASYGMNVETPVTTANPFESYLKASYKPVQEFKLKPGENVAIAIAAGLMNRIKTNFKRVSVRTSDADTILEASDGYVYITTNKMNPLGLIINEEGMPETAVSLVLQPDNTPPSMVTVDVDLSPSQIAKANEIQRERNRLKKIDMLSQVDKEKDKANSHVERIKSMLLPIAQQDIPKGFTESDASEIPRPFDTPCSVAIRQKTAQRFTGAREWIDVVVLYNQTNYDYQIKEEMCLTRDAMAVAIMNQSILQPGQSTEVYIVRDKLYSEKQERTNRRKSISADDLGLTQ